MTLAFAQHFEKLKLKVLAIAGITNITPHDCKGLSALIFKNTKHSVSETTLKRIYGFAFSKYKPSAFTIDAMANFCNYESWDSFCEQQEYGVSKNTEENANWRSLKSNADKLTGFTLQVLQNKSGIPYQQTVKRKFVDDHFSEFLSGKYTGTVFSAPAGYGKTIALCHWVEERLLQNSLGQTNDIILFFSGSALMNAFLTGRDLNQWILSLLGYSSDVDIRSLMDGQDKPGNFYLIIDDLGEHTYKPEQFKLLLNQLIDITSLYQFSPWFKLVLTMRSATWINNRHNIDTGHSKWFKGFISDDDSAVNVPLLNVREIKEICQKINPNVQNFFALDIAEDFNHPLFFQFYYQEHKDDFMVSKIDHICIYDLVSTFILNKVYLGPHSAEKILLLSALVDEMDFETHNYEISKTRVNALIKQYHQAYNDLISVGFLREINISSNLRYYTVIRFGNSNFLEYTLAKKLLAGNKDAFDAALIDVINIRFNGTDNKLNILKWCIIYAIKTGQQKSFELLAETRLQPKDRSDLIIFLGDLLQKTSTSPDKSESLIQYFKQDCSDGLFNYFFGLEFINIHYKETLLTLLKFELSSNKRIMIYTALAATALIQLDIDDLKQYIAILKQFPPENFSSFAINPLNCINALYNYLKHGVHGREIFVELTRFYFNPPVEGGYFRDSASNDLLYLLAAYTLLIFQKPVKILRFTNVLKKYYKPADLSTNTGYSFFLNMIKADCHFKLGNTSELIKLNFSFSAFYNTCKHSMTDYMRTAFYSFRIKVNIMLKEYDDIVQDMRLFNNITVDHKLSKINTLVIILQDNDISIRYPQFYKQCHYDYHRLLRDCGLASTLFLTEGLPVNNF